MKARWNLYKELWTVRNPKRVLAEIFHTPANTPNAYIVLIHTTVPLSTWIMEGSQKKQFATFSDAKRAAEKMIGAEVKR